MKKFYLLFFMLLVSLTITACNGEEEPEETIEQSDLEALLETLDLPDETKENITLETSVDNFDITWQSADESYLSHDGSVERPRSDSGDQTVVLTAMITHENIEASKDFEIKVLATSALEEVLMDIELPAMTDEDLELPLEDGAYTITWSSDDPSYLNSRGQVARPRYEVGDQTVVLTATSSDFDGRNTAEKSFEITVEAYSQEETEAAMDAALNQLELPSEVTEDIDLSRYLRDFEVIWSSDDDTVMDEEGRVFRPANEQGDQTLTLSVKLVDGDIEKTADFEITVLAYTETEETAMTLFEETIEDFDFVGGTFDEDIDLPTQVGEVSIDWRSLRPGIIHNDGTVNPVLSAHTDRSIPLEATMSYQDVTMQYTVEVYVSKTLDQNIVDSKTLPFENLADEWLLSDTDIEIFYTDDRSLPYVDIESFLTLLDGGDLQGAIDFESIDIDIDQDIMYLEVFVAAVDDDPEDTFVEDTTYVFEINFSENRASVNRYGFFTSFQESTQTDFGAGLDVVDYEVEYFDPVVFELGDYRMELFMHEDQYLMPLHIANLFFSGSMFDVYYNGDALYGVDTYQIYPMQEDVREIILDSSYNDLEMSASFLSSNYDYLAFSLDHYFGLREDMGIDSFYNVLDKDDLTDAEMHYQSLFSMVYGLDDLHSSFGNTGIYDPDYDPTLALDHLGPRTQNFYNSLWDLQDMGTCDRNEVIYYDDGRVARVPLHGFNADTPDEFKRMLDEIEAMGGVEDVIVDLSCNTGGIIGGMIQVLGYITDEDIPYHSINAGDLSTQTVWYTSEYEAYDFEWHFLISPVTYSAGNSMAQIVKEMDLGTLFGEQSQGGASSVTSNLLPSGGIIFMSSPNVLTDEAYQSLEYGVEPNVTLRLFQMESPRMILSAIEDDEE